MIISLKCLLFSFKKDYFIVACYFASVMFDKVWMYEEIMTNDDNLESNLLTSSLLKMLVQVELYVFTAQWQEMN